MWRPKTLFASAGAALLLATSAFAETTSPREIWPQATAAVDAGDIRTADQKVNELLEAGKAAGLRRYPVFAESAIALARQATAEKNSEVAKWALKVAPRLDPYSPNVAFSLADLQRSQGNWGGALGSLFRGFSNVARDYTARTIARSDLMIALSIAIAGAVALWGLLLLFRYSRAAAHDFREMLAQRFGPGTTTVLGYALLFAPLFLWLGPVWLVAYWLALLFGYANRLERIVTVILLLLAAGVPLLLDRAAYQIAGVNSPVVRAAVRNEERSYDIETLRRLRELTELVPEEAKLHLLLGNLHVQDGDEQQAAVHYRKATDLSDSLAGAHLNLGNLHFYENDFVAATSEYERAAQIAPRMSIAHYNQSVANGEQYKFDVQGQKLEEAKKHDRALVERLLANPPAQKVVMYNLPLPEAWELAQKISKNRASHEVFGNYARFDFATSLPNIVTIAALLSIVAGVVVYLMRRRSGFAGQCIKCGRTFCHRCKSSKESAIYCTQCIHIYLKRDGVSIDTKRAKLDEVHDFQSGSLRRRKIVSTFFPGAGQVLEGSTIKGVIALLLFLIAVTVAVFAGRLAPMAYPADLMRLFMRVAAISVAVVVWLVFTIPVLRQRFSS